MTFWAVFIGLVVVPLLALAMEVGRYWFARAQTAAGTDAAALAAAVEINQRVFMETGRVVLPTANTYLWAQRAVDANTTWLLARGIHARVSGIVVTENTVQVSVSADLERLFPAITPDITVTEIGRAEVRALRQP
jgi:Flp pilus assembly protein TadG